MDDCWYKMAVTPGQWSLDFKSRLQKDFQSEYLRNGAPPGVAVLSSNQPSLISETEVSHFVYFSPAAVKLFPTLLNELNFVGCDAPFKSEVSLLAGDDKVYDSLNSFS